MKSIFAGTALALTVLMTAASLGQESIVGVGISLGADRATGDLKIMKVVAGGPADKAGIKAGLVLRKVNDVELTGKGMTDAVGLIRGPIGSKVTLDLVDLQAHSTNKVELTRDKIILAAPVKAKRGDAAAPLTIKEWAQGGPVDVKDGKAVYVVEFWATWCGPCRVSIPHLTELQKRFKDKGVVVVGVSDEAPGTVKPFVTKMGEKMAYAVACDDDQQTYGSYMAAYGHNGIPTAFIVGKDGRVLWDGHPMAGLDKALEDVLAGKPVE